MNTRTTVRTRTTSTGPAGNIHKRHTKRQRERIRAMKRRRFIFFSTLTLIVVLVVMFFTPLFTIRRVDITGNFYVSTGEIQQSVGTLEGKNLFRTGMGRIRKNILKFPYVDTVKVKRRLIPPSVRVDIVECKPGGYILENEKFIIIDEKAKVLEVTETEPTEIPKLEGLELSKFEPGASLEITDDDKFSVMLQCLQEMQKLDVLRGVEMISFTDMANIMFNYENRLDVVCGSDVEMPKKIRLFREAIYTSSLTENSRGTIDLSIVGTARYIP